MEVEYWDCEFNDYEETWDGENECRYYYCSHPKGDGHCELDNKYCCEKEDCKLLDSPLTKPLKYGRI